MYRRLQPRLWALLNNCKKLMPWLIRHRRYFDGQKWKLRIFVWLERTIYRVRTYFVFERDVNKSRCPSSTVWASCEAQDRHTQFEQNGTPLRVDYEGVAWPSSRYDLITSVWAYIYFSRFESLLLQFKRPAPYVSIIITISLSWKIKYHNVANSSHIYGIPIPAFSQSIATIMTFFPVI